MQFHLLAALQAACSKGNAGASGRFLERVLTHQGVTIKRGMFGNMAVIAKQHPIRILVSSSQGCWHWAELAVCGFGRDERCGTVTDGCCWRKHPMGALCICWLMPQWIIWRRKPLDKQICKFEWNVEPALPELPMSWAGWLRRDQMDHNKLPWQQEY